MIFLLQPVALNSWPIWHVPLHRAGTGLYPVIYAPILFRDSGQMPESMTPMMISSRSLLSGEAGQLLWLLAVVKIEEVPAPGCVCFMIGVRLHADNFRELMVSACDLVSIAANPENPCL